MKINLCIDNKKFLAKPGSSDAAIISSRIASSVEKLTLNELAAAIGDGRTYCLGLFNDSTRKASKWHSQQIFAADIDDANVSLEKLLQLSKEFQSKYGISPSIIHESFSSTPLCRKWRVLFISSEPVADPRLCLSLLRIIKEHYNADPAVVDLARILYGTTREKLSYVADNLFDISLINLPETAVVTATYAQVCKALPAKSKMTHANKGILGSIKRNIIYGSGSRYQLIWHGARKLAQLGVFSEKDIINHILDACKQAGPRYNNYDKDIKHIINTAISWGADHQYEAKSAGQELALHNTSEGLLLGN